MKYSIYIIALCFSLIQISCSKDTGPFQPTNPVTTTSDVYDDSNIDLPDKNQSQVLGGEDDDIPMLSFTGKLVDPESNAIVGATVELDNHPVYYYSTTTNSAGEFSIPDVKMVAYDLTLTASGFVQEIHPIDLDGASDPYDWGTEVMVRP